MHRLIERIAVTAGYGSRQLKEYERRVQGRTQLKGKRKIQYQDAVRTKGALGGELFLAVGLNGAIALLLIGVAGFTLYIIEILVVRHSQSGLGGFVHHRYGIVLLIVELPGLFFLGISFLRQSQLRRLPSNEVEA